MTARIDEMETMFMNIAQSTHFIPSLKYDAGCCNADSVILITFNIERIVRDEDNSWKIEKFPSIERTSYMMGICTESVPKDENILFIKRFIEHLTDPRAPIRDERYVELLGKYIRNYISSVTDYRESHIVPYTAKILSMDEFVDILKKKEYYKLH